MSYDTGIKSPKVTDYLTKDESIDLAKSMLDVIYFTENFVKVQHPTKGAVPFRLYPFQRELLHNFSNYKHNIALISRQMGKTATSGAYILWFGMFQKDKTILIVAHNLKMAIEIIDRIKFAYKELPNFIKEPILEWNKTTITFANGSKIVARAASADSARGLSVSLLYCDENSFLRPSIQKEFWTAIRPVLSTGGDSIVTSTPGSDEDEFAQMWRAANDTIRPDGSDGDVGRNGYKATFAIWSDHPERGDDFEKKEKAAMGEERFLREHCCRFISLHSTLIDSYVLEQMVPKEPVYTMGEVRWFKRPEYGYSYFLVLDPSLGTSNDWAAIQIIEMPTLEHVGEWVSNTAPPKKQVQVLFDILNYIKSEIAPDDDLEDTPIYWSFENNTIGEAVLQTIEDSGLDNFPGMLVSEKRNSNSNKRFRKGINTSNSKKINSCSKFKSLVDSGRLVPKSVGSIKQLKNFTANGASFSAGGSGNDDLVMSMILTVRLIEMTKTWDVYDPDVLSDAIETEFNEPMMFIPPY